jgi:hypothetical protein
VVSCAPLVAGKIPGAFIPPDDLSQTQVAVTLPPGSTFAQTLAVAEQAEALVRAHPHVKLVYTAIGGGKAGADPFMSAGAAESNKATLTLNLTPRDQRPGITKQAIEADLRQAMDALPGARVKVGFGGSAEKFILVLAGEDGDALATMRVWSSRNCAPCPASAMSRPPPACSGPSWPCGPTTRARPTWVSPRPPSPTRCAWPPPATTSRRWPS